MTPEQEIETLIIPNSGQSFTGDDFRMLLKPIVYMFMKAGLPLYVGMSRRGITRPSGAHHVAKAREECDEVKIFPCINEGAAYRLEQILISRTNPLYNERLRQAEAKRLTGISSSINTLAT